MTSELFQEMQRFRYLERLKEVYRISSVEKRKESTAEHTYGCLILADLVMSYKDFNVDRQKVMDLILYHDVVEIEVGDTPFEPGSKRTDKMELERKAAQELKTKIPKTISEKYIKLFEEFEERETREAKFAKLIDLFESQIHEFDYKEDWKGWSADFLVSNREHYFEDFPELKEIFFEMIEWLESEGYFSQ